MNRKALIKSITIIVTFIILTVLLSQVRLGDIVNTLISMDPLFLFGGFILYIVSYVLRSYRFHFLLNREVSIRDLFPIVCVHNMANNILPARTGELSYVYLLKKQHNMRAGQGVATLLVARIFDLLAVIVFFVSSLLLIDMLPDEIINTALIAAVIFFTLSISVVFFFYLPWRIKSTEKDPRYKSHYPENPFLLKISGKISEILNYILEIRQGNKKNILYVAIISIFIWFFLYLFYFFSACAMHIDTGFLPTIFAASFVVFTMILPIQGMAGFGTVEGGWAFGFILIGISEITAISSAFGFHAITLLFTIIAGSFGYTIFIIKERKICGYDN
ncbi:lysylphosphatidylglycerol synthase transmembrane domain-containing protein [Methanocalculus sp.]|uniref:lysylphosphatidylglycerol synthase transmembrane domain-containing protein n=1 Tax=Methanocalculus sp. TaxID=2004547 RepID=UPI00261693B6|nr:lysylphosphatidylglycerol synthase transmembrane domain-containing protein [Methanocalculus sp.]MDG6249463.1 lysylphosphatidylglycerol synthase transmembrane domain-containing protein [Methanocalculus sp.]